MVWSAEYRPLDALSQLTFHHGGATGKIFGGVLASGQRRKGFLQQRYEGAQRLPDLVTALDALQPGDTYYAQNTFRAAREGDGWHFARRIEQLRELRALWVDLDCYRHAMPPHDCLGDVWDGYVRRRKMLPPHLITLSGQGLALVWLIRPLPPYGCDTGCGDNLSTWQRAMHALLAACPEAWGADPACADAARMLRLAGYRNSKSGVAVEVYADRSLPRYSLTDFLGAVPVTAPRSPASMPPTPVTLQVVPPHPAQPNPSAPNLRGKIGNPRQGNSDQTPDTLRAARLEDLEHLVQLRGAAIVGCREVMLHVYVDCMLNRRSVWDPERAAADARRFAATFTAPLPPEETEAIVQAELRRVHARRGTYGYANATIIDKLGITDDEQASLSTLIGARERYRRRGKGKGKFHRRREERLRALVQLRQSGHDDVTELGDLLGICERRVRQLLEEVRARDSA